MSKIRLIAGLAVTLALAGSATGPYRKNQKAFYADPKTIAFVRPGLVITIVSASIAADGTITTDFRSS